MDARWTLVVLVLVIGMGGRETEAWDCAAGDRLTLLEFKAGFVDRDGVFSTWNATTNCCSWKGVKCREIDGAVLELAIVGSEGYGNSQTYRDSSYGRESVGAGLVALTSLQELTIQWVLFNCPIPEQWGEFSSNLEKIVINNANLRDRIPSTLASIPKLRHLDLKYNHLTGSIPTAFCEQQSIQYIDVSFNDMSNWIVPWCFQGQNNNRNVEVIYGNQGQSTSPGNAAGATLAFPSVVFGAISFALLLKTLL